MKKLLPLALLVVLAACKPAAPAMDDHSMHSEMTSAAASAATSDRLSNSPRHQEWVTVKNGDRNIRTFVVYPESSEKASVVLVIHENKGLNDWARGMADQLAEQGYIAVAPDLLSEFDASHADTSAFASDDERTQAINKLDPQQVKADLQAVVAWADTIPASNGKLAAAGFCWGGTQSFALATTDADVDKTLVFYGTAPTDMEELKNITSPVYGFYAGNDERVDATLPDTTRDMAKAGKSYDLETYAGAGHAFMRTGEDPNGDPANVAARNDAWDRMMDVLGTL
jgi:carboxymethylenebutenolidase